MLGIPGTLSLNDDVTVDIFDSGGLEPGAYTLISYHALSMGAYDFVLGQTPAGFDYALDAYGPPLPAGGPGPLQHSGTVILNVTEPGGQVIPEPASALAVALGAGGLAGYVRRRRR
jgi:hypothetical protein